MRGLKELPDGRFRVSYMDGPRWVRRIVAEKADALQMLRAAHDHKFRYQTEYRIKGRMFRPSMKTILPDEERYLYLISNPTLAAVKIGIAANPMKRLRALQTNFPHPISLTHCFRGGRRAESFLHKRLRPHRLCGEWFTLGDHIQQAISEACSCGLLLTEASS